MIPSLTKQRIVSIDMLRGLIMIIMALDHVRDFFHQTAMTADPLNIDNTTPALFFTRWITHFCAPVFVFLSGLSAALAAKNKTRKEAAAFLIKRGLWLVVVEVVIITFALSFDPLYNVLFFQVIWAIGMSMIVLGLLMFLNDTIILMAGIVLVAGHNIFYYLPIDHDNALLKVFFTAKGFIVPLGDSRFLAFFYAVLPWTGVMLLGYSIAKWYMNDTVEKRKMKLLYAGVGTITLFIVLRLINKYGDEQQYVERSTKFNSFLSFINTSKYPPSLLYICMTLGPALIFLSLAENIKGVFAKVCTVYGKVPFFYFVLHFYIIHTLLIIVFFATGHGTDEIVSKDIPFLFRPATFGFSLPVVYLIWILLVVALYRPCQWFAKYKEANKHKWWIHYV